MKCPVCVETDLVMTERQNVEIDYCPKCRGVWLDRGELDKIIERSAAEMAPQPQAMQPQGMQPQAMQPQAPQPQAQPDYGYGRGGHHGGGGHGGGKHGGYRRKSWLTELFD